MAIPVVVGASLSGSGNLTADTASPITPPFPSGYTVVSGDICVVALMTNKDNTFTTPTGYTSLGSITDANQSSAWFWRRLQTGDTAPSCATSGGSTLNPTNGFYGRLWIIRGCKTVGDPFEDATFAGTPTISGTPQSALITTTDADRLVLSMVVVDNDNTWTSGMPPGAGWVNAGPFSNSTTGGDGMMDAVAINRSGAGDVASVQFGLMNSTDYWRTLTLAFIPDLPQKTGGIQSTGSLSASKTVVPQKTGGVKNAASGPSREGVASTGGIGSNWSSGLSIDLKRVTKLTVNQSHNIDGVQIYYDGNGGTGGTTTIKAVIYSDSGDAPSALLGVSDEQIVNSGDDAGFITFSFSPSVAVSPGVYWVGVLRGGTAGVARHRFDLIAGNQGYANSDSYSDGPDDPFGAATSDTIIVATRLLAGTAKSVLVAKNGGIQSAGILGGAGILGNADNSAKSRISWVEFEVPFQSVLAKTNGIESAGSLGTSRTALFTKSGGIESLSSLGASHQTVTQKANGISSSASLAGSKAVLFAKTSGVESPALLGGAVLQEGSISKSGGISSQVAIGASAPNTIYAKSGGFKSSIQISGSRNSQVAKSNGIESSIQVGGSKSISSNLGKSGGIAGIASLGASKSVIFDKISGSQNALFIGGDNEIVADKSAGIENGASLGGQESVSTATDKSGGLVFTGSLGASEQVESSKAGGFIGISALGASKQVQIENSKAGGLTGISTLGVSRATVQTRINGIQSIGSLSGSVSLAGDTSRRSRISWIEFEVPGQPLLTKSGGIESTGLLGGSGEGVLIFSKTGGIQSSLALGGSGVRDYVGPWSEVWEFTLSSATAKSGGSIGVSTLGGVESITYAKNGGINAIAQTGGSLPEIGGIQSQVTLSGAQETIFSKAYGIESAGLLGGTAQKIFSKVGGIQSAGSFGATRVFSVVKSGGIESESIVEVSKIISLIKASGIESTLSTGGNAFGFTATSKTGGIGGEVILGGEQSIATQIFTKSGGFEFSAQISGSRNSQIAKFNGIESSIQVGGSKSISSSLIKPGGIQSAIQIGATPSSVFTKSDGIESSTQVGGTLNIIFSKTGGIESIAETGGFQGAALVYEKTGGIQSAPQINGSNAVAWSRSGGIISTGSLSASKASTAAKTGGTTSQATSSFSKLVTAIKAAGLTSATRLGGSQGASLVFDKTGGFESISQTGVSRAIISSKTGGIVSIASTLAIPGYEIDRTGGIVSNTQTGASKTASFSKVGGIEAAGLVGAFRVAFFEYGGFRLVGSIGGVVSILTTIPDGRPGMLIAAGGEAPHLIGADGEDIKLIGGNLNAGT
jgi:hypothetical protein